MKENEMLFAARSAGARSVDFRFRVFILLLALCWMTMPGLSPAAQAQTLSSPTLSAVAGNGQVSLNWSAVPGATSYNLYRSVTGSTSPATLIWTSSLVTSPINDTDSSITYSSSNWSYGPGRGLGDLDDDVHATSANGDAFSYTFTGTGISYLTETNGDEGNVQVYLDGTLQATVNCAASTRQTQQAVWSISSLAGGSHTLKVVKQDGQYMLLDALKVTAPLLSFTDTAVMNGTSYTYYVTAAGSSATSSASNSVTVTPSASQVNGAVLALNAGGGATGSFAADADFTGGGPAAYSGTTDTSGVTNPAPAAVYQSERYGAFSYTLPGFNPGSTYTVRLHFAEIYFGPGLTGGGGAGSRQFNVGINGTPVLTNFDIFAAAGGADKAVVETFPATADASGNITVAFTNGAADLPKVDGIEVLAGAPAAPVAPAGLTATPGNGSVALSWTSVPGPVSYNVYRSAVSGGPYIKIGSVSAGLSYVDMGLTNGTTYFYVVTASSSSGESTYSAAVSATPTASLPPAAVDLLALNAGGGAVGSFSADEYYEGGGPAAYSGTTDTSGVTNPAPAAVYQTERYGTFSYVLPGFNPGSAYTVRLHFAEIYFGPGLTGGGGAGSRQFNVGINGTPVLTNFDIFAAAGGADKAVVETFPATADASGNITVAFTNGAADNPKVDGIEVLASVPPLLSSVAISPGSATLNRSGIQQFSATALDQNGNALSPQPAFSWSVVSGGGTISAAGHYTAGTTAGNATVQARSGSVSGTATVSVAAGPVATNLAAQASGSTAVLLTWNVASQSDTFNLYRSTTAGGEGSTPYKTGVSSPYSYDSGLSTGTTYYYQVTEVGSTGEGPKTNEASATPGSTALTAPVLGGTTSGTQDTLEWSTVDGATSYNLYRNYVLYQQGLTSGTFTDTGLTNGTSYQYYVCAVNIGGQGTQSNQVTLTPGSPALPAPSLSAQVSGSTGALLVWTPVPGATQYDLYRSTSPGGEGAAPYQVNVGSYNYYSGQPDTDCYDSNLTPGMTYYYKVVAVGSGGEGAFSNEASATVGTQPLAGPVLAGTTTGTHATLSWSAVAGATSYNLYRNYVLYQPGLAGTMFTDAGLTNGTSYQYYVCAVSQAGQGSQSNSVSLTPGLPALPAPSLSAHSFGNAEVDLSWTPVPGATQYDLYRSTSAGGEGATPYLANVSANNYGYYSTYYPDTGLTTGTTYYYKVVAAGPGGEGAFSNEAWATPGATLLPAPTLTATADPTRIAITLSWSAVAGATSYNLYRSNYAYQPGLTSTSFTDTDLLPSGSANYYVVAVNQSGEGTASNYASAQVNGFFLTCPSTVTVAHGMSAAFNLKLTPLGTFAGNVLLSGGASPTGTEGLFYPAAPAVNSAVDINYSITSNLYFNVGSTTTPGSYPITITGTANGFTYSTSLTLIVQ